VSGDRFLGWRTPWGTLLLQSANDHHEPKVYYPEWQTGEHDRPSLPDATDRRCPRVVARVEKWLTSIGVPVVRIPFGGNS